MVDDAPRGAIEKQLLDTTSDVLALRIVTMFLLSRVAADRRTKPEADKWIAQLRFDVNNFLDGRFESNKFETELFPKMRKEIETIFSAVSFD